MKTVTCKSGIEGWQNKLRKVYNDFAEWESCATIYNLHFRLGYKSPKAAWKANPTIQGSVIPSDYRKVKE